MSNRDATFYDVVGIGNAMVDVMAKVGDGFLSERKLAKSEMTLVNAQDAGKIYADIMPEREVSGGSAANTVAGLASLGGAPAFIGKVHDDELGQEFSRSIGGAGVDFFTKPLNQGPMTGRSIVLVTPDAERSMFTYLGAAAKLSAEDIDEDIIKSTKIVYLEGYLWDEGEAKEAIKKACELAHKHNKKVAFSLSDKSCVDRHREEFLKLISDSVDILFGNEEEIKALFQEADFYKTLDMIKTEVETAAITRSDKGSVIVNGRTKTFVEAEKVRLSVWLYTGTLPRHLRLNRRHCRCGNHQPLRCPPGCQPAGFCPQQTAAIWQKTLRKKRCSAEQRFYFFYSQQQTEQQQITCIFYALP